MWSVRPRFSWMTSIAPRGVVAGEKNAWSVPRGPANVIASPLIGFPAAEVPGAALEADGAVEAGADPDAAGDPADADAPADPAAEPLTDAVADEPAEAA